MGTVNTHRHIMTADHSRYDAAMNRSAAATRATSDTQRSLVSSIALIDGPLGGVASRASNLNQIISRGNVLFGSFAVALSGVGFGVAKMLKVVSETQVEMGKTEAILRATGGASGLLSSELDEMARNVALATLASTTQIRQAISSLLTFKSVGSEIFESTIKLSQDMAFVWGGTAATQAKKLGKALEDPERQLSRLETTVGAFNAKTRESILEMAKMGDLAGAQRLIIESLEERIGGVAEGKGLAYAVDTLAQRWSEFFEQLDKTSGISGLVERELDNISNGILRMTDALKPTTADEKINELFNLRNKLLLNIVESQRKYNVLRNQADMGSASEEDVSRQASVLRNARNRITIIDNEIKALRLKRDIGLESSNSEKDQALETEKRLKKEADDAQFLAELDKMIFDGQQNKYKILAEVEKERQARLKDTNRSLEEQARLDKELMSAVVNIRNRGLAPLERENQLHKDNIVKLDEYRAKFGNTDLLNEALSSENARNIRRRQEIAAEERERSFSSSLGDANDFGRSLSITPESMALEQQQFRDRMDAIQAFRDADIDNLIAANNLMEDEQKRHADSMVRIAELEAQSKQRAQQNFWNAASSLMNSQSRKLFEIGKIAAISNAVISATESVPHAYKWGTAIGGPVLGAAFAATAIAATATQIQAINNTQFGSTSASSGASSVAGAQPAFQAPVDSRREVNINFNGNISGIDADHIANMLKDHLDSTDFVLIEKSSRNGQELVA